MTGGDGNKVINYMENILPLRIVESNADLKDCKIIKCKATSSKSLDGFLSMIFQVDLLLYDKKSERQHTLKLIAKILRNDANFREITRLDDMTINELKFYSQILPIYKNILKKADIEDDDVAPRFYYGFYGFDKDFSDGETPEGVFVFENLTSAGYRLGPRDKLDEQHILLMTEAIAKIHATSYAFKIQDREKFDKFVATFQVIPFSGEGKTMFDPFYKVALERLVKYVKASDQTADYTSAVLKLRDKYIDKPSMLLQDFLVPDTTFDTIIHGDYNRNNVMFKYDSPEGFEKPSSVKMFDFQWVKKGSPALDLSFFLYMNLDPDLFERCWNQILEFYHKTLIKSLAGILHCEENDERLLPFNFNDFLEHFSKYAFYGCAISTWFLPTMLTDSETCSKLETECCKDLFSQAVFDVCMLAGSPEIMERVNANVKHAFDRGYMRRLLE